MNILNTDKWLCQIRLVVGLLWPTLQAFAYTWTVSRRGTCHTIFCVVTFGNSGNTLNHMVSGTMLQI